VNSQQLLILNAVILLVLIIWFLTGRRAGMTKPTQLRMKDGNGPTDSGPAAKGPLAARPATATKRGGRYSDPKFQKYLAPEPDPATTSAKELNVLFNYNGHSWDAYEVLGVPAGENIVAVTRAYQELVKKSSPESLEFLETAYQAILRKN
jgi:hypothetical protein